MKPFPFLVREHQVVWTAQPDDALLSWLFKAHFGGHLDWACNSGLIFPETDEEDQHALVLGRPVLWTHHGLVKLVGEV